jgi:hypothetical protein
MKSGTRERRWLDGVRTAAAGGGKVLPVCD